MIFFMIVGTLVVLAVLFGFGYIAYMLEVQWPFWIAYSILCAIWFAWIILFWDIGLSI